MKKIILGIFLIFSFSFGKTDNFKYKDFEYLYKNSINLIDKNSYISIDKSLREMELKSMKFSNIQQRDAMLYFFKQLKTQQQITQHLMLFLLSLPEEYKIKKQLFEIIKK